MLLLVPKLGFVRAYTGSGSPRAAFRGMQYLHVFKAGGTSVQAAMRPDYATRIRRGDHKGEELLDRMPTFATVRDPVARFVSGAREIMNLQRGHFSSEHEFWNIAHDTNKSRQLTRILRYATTPRWWNRRDYAAAHLEASVRFFIRKHFAFPLHSLVDIADVHHIDPNASLQVLRKGEGESYDFVTPEQMHMICHVMIADYCCLDFRLPDECTEYFNSSERSAETLKLYDEATAALDESQHYLHPRPVSAKQTLWQCAMDRRKEVRGKQGKGKGKSGSGKPGGNSKKGKKKKGSSKAEEAAERPRRGEGLDSIPQEHRTTVSVSADADKPPVIPLLWGPHLFSPATPLTRCGPSVATEWNASTLTLKQITALRRASELSYAQAKREGSPHWLQLFHVHKSGGTAFCKKAQSLAGMVPPTPHTNCNPKDDRVVRFAAKDLAGQCSAFYGPLADSTIVANEFEGSRVIALGLPLIYVAIFRHPLERLISQWSFTCVRRSTGGFALSELISSRSNEYLLKYMMGFSRGEYQVKEPLQKAGYFLAKKRLHTLSAIIILEDYESSLRAGMGRLGWKLNFTAFAVKEFNTAEKGGKLAERPACEHPKAAQNWGFNETEMEILNDANKYSLRLYADAQKLSKALVQEPSIEY